MPFIFDFSIKKLTLELLIIRKIRQRQLEVTIVMESQLGGGLRDLGIKINGKRNVKKIIENLILIKKRKLREGEYTYSQRTEQKKNIQKLEYLLLISRSSQQYTKSIDVLFALIHEKLPSLQTNPTDKLKEDVKEYLVLLGLLNESTHFYIEKDTYITSADAKERSLNVIIMKNMKLLNNLIMEHAKSPDK